jgi:hypothetical protein
MQLPTASHRIEFSWIQEWWLWNYSTIGSLLLKWKHIPCYLAWTRRSFFEFICTWRRFHSCPDRGPLSNKFWYRSPNFQGIFDGIGNKVGNNIESMIANGATAVSLGRRKNKAWVYFCGAEAIAKDINAAAIAATRGDITFTISNKYYL